MPAVGIADGAQAVGVAHAYDDALGVEGVLEGNACPVGQLLRAEGSQGVAQQDGPDIGGAGAGIAGSQHTEYNAEGNAVEGRADEVVVAQDEQAVNTQIHQHHSVAQGAGNVIHLAAILQKLPVVLGGATQEQGDHHAQAEQSKHK